MKKPSLNLKKYLLFLAVLILVVFIAVLIDEYFKNPNTIEIVFKDKNLDRQKQEEIARLVGGKIYQCFGKTCFVKVGLFMTREKAVKILENHPDVDYLPPPTII